MWTLELKFQSKTIMEIEILLHGPTAVLKMQNIMYVN